MMIRIQCPVINDLNSFRTMMNPNKLIAAYPRAGITDEK